MNIFKKSIYALSLIGLAALGSCSSEELMDGENRPAGKSVAMTISVAREGVTRTAFTENTETGGLTDVWTEGDYLHVHSTATGEEVGTLKLIEGAGDATGVFVGEVNVEGDGEQELALWYYDDVASNPNLSFENLTVTSNKKALKVDLRTQEYKSLEDLARMNILYNKVAVNVKGKESTVVKNEVMKPAMALARISLAGLEEGSKGTLEITDLNGSKAQGEPATIVEVKFGLNLGAESGMLQSSTHDELHPWTVTNVEAGKDVYMALIPSKNNKPYKFGFKFTNAADGKTYSYNFETETLIEAGKYYTSFTKEEGADNGTFGGVQVPMEEDKQIDHSVNPLAKWAKGDLIRSGSGKSVTGTVLDDPFTTGSYYQFGRNYGYNSASEVSQLCTEQTLSNYYFTFRGAKYTAVPENGIYNAASMKMFKDQNAMSSQTVTTMTDYPAMFFMNAGDYVSPGYTQDWKARAKTMGYTNDTPCPDEWTIPTRADFEQILPLNGNTVGATSWNTISQVKLIGTDKIPCAFRWSKEGSALKIECLVLADKDDTPNWDDEHVVVRYFNLAGCLTSFMQAGYLDDRNLSTVQYVADVKNYGAYDTKKVLGATSGLNSIYYMQCYQLANYMAQTGFYWTSDADQQVFTLNTNSSISSYPNVGYYFTKTTVTIGANIRCIRK